MKLLKIFSITTISSFVGIGTAAGISAVIGASAQSHTDGITMKIKALTQKRADTLLWADYEKLIKNNDPTVTDKWHAENDWKSNLSHYSIIFNENEQTGQFTYVPGHDYDEAQGKILELQNGQAKSNDADLIRSCTAWTTNFSYLLIGLGVATLPSIAYLLKTKKIKKTKKD